MAPYLRGTRYPLLSPEEIKWLLRDEFNGTLAAGSVNGTLSDSGHLRTVVDTESKLSLAGGALMFSGGKAAPAYGDPGLWESAVTRAAGMMLFIQGSIAIDTTKKFGFDTNQTGDAIAGGTVVGLTSGESINFNFADSSPVTVGTYSAADYKFGVVLRSTGGLLFIKGSAFTNWTLLSIAASNNTATIYPCIINYNSADTFSFLRIPDALWLPVPLLSTSGAMTWPTTNGLGHAEGVAGGLGAGGSGLTLLDIGTWAADGTYLTNTPVAGATEYVSNGSMETGDPPTGWNVLNGSTLDSVADERTGGSGTASLSVTRGTSNASVNQVLTLQVGRWYKLNGWQKIVTASQSQFGLGSIINGVDICASGYLASAAWVNSVSSGRATAATCYLTGWAVTSGEARFDDISVKPLPISSLITNVSLATTDVLAEALLHAYTLGSQMGIVQSDRSFAAKAASTAAAGQAVISLKEIGDASATGLTTNDTITIKHAGGDATYTIASVAGGSNVAYNDTTKTQTVTLGSNLGAQVNVDDKVGLDWASWNGALCYFDGAGNIKLDEVKAGVYTNRGSTAKAFSANARFIVRKIGSEYRIFFNEALVGSAISTVAAGAMVGTYWGLFSTLAANQVTSMVVYDTGNVTNSHSILDRYSKD